MSHSLILASKNRMTNLNLYRNKRISKTIPNLKVLLYSKGAIIWNLKNRMN